jgi:protein SCO1/2
MNRSLLWIVFGGLVGLLIIFTGTYLISRNYTYNGSLFDPPVQAQNFELIDQNGNLFQLDQQAGKIVILFFGYTHCADVCPVTLNEFKHIRATLGDQADQVRFVFITVDPERDSPQVLQDNLVNYDPAIIGLTGEMERLAAVWKDYGIYVEKQPIQGPSNYEVDHTARIFVIDKGENLLLTYPYNMEEEKVVSDLQHLLKSQ